MKLYRDQAVVLRTHKLGEADRIITLLTREHGRVRAVAKGVRRTTSRLGARVEPFMHVDIQLHAGRNLDVVTQVETLGAYGLALAPDYELFTTATAVVEAAERFTEVEREPATQQYLLAVGALHALAARRHAPGLILDSYLLRSLALAGYAPSFLDCARCGAPGPHRAFNSAAGGAVCPACRPPGSAAPSPAAFTLLAALLTGDWAAAEEADPGTGREAAGVVAAYAQWHMERQVRSLRLVYGRSAPCDPAPFARDGEDPRSSPSRTHSVPMERP
ncbi:MAG: DNA repair protein RecO [Bifidobacteriaceae bacterium]|nr:DNA repair protein RecO [Bifidobacteriaceae bacterium]